MPEVLEASFNKTIKAAGVTDRGRTREHNEDAFIVRDDLRLYVVADGAGGHKAGDIASKLVVKSIENFFEATQQVAQKKPRIDRFGLSTQSRRLAAAVQKANSDVMEIARSFQERRGMGSTVVVAYFRPEWERLYLAHVGDSRCYRLRAGNLELLTHDHTMLNDVMEMRPDVDDAVLARLPRSVVTRAIGLLDRVRVELRSVKLRPGDRFLLCSDGLFKDLEEEVLEEALQSSEKPEEIARQLVVLANEVSGSDNITALVIDYDKPKNEAVSTFSTSSRDCKESPRERLQSGPEIMLLGIESDVDIEPSGQVRIVPSDDDDEALRGIVEEFVAPLRGDQASNPIDLTVQSQCGACGEQIPVGARFCPFCGAARKR